MSTISQKASVGRDYSCNENLREILEIAGREGYDFVTMHLAQPWCCYTTDNLPDELPLMTRPDLKETIGGWNYLVVAKISPWIDVDSEDERLRKISEKALRAELTYYEYSRVATVMVELKRRDHVNLAKIINEFVSSEKNFNRLIWVSVPLNNENDETDDPWFWFYSFRTACENSDRIGLALKLTTKVPEKFDSEEMNRWYGEPIKTLVLDTSLFSTAAKNGHKEPFLNDVYANLLKKFYGLYIQILITGPPLHEKHFTPAVTKSTDSLPLLSPYFTYCNYLYKNQLECPYEQYQVLGWEDRLYQPAAPLIETLSYFTYDGYESDGRKYRRYRHALSSMIAKLIWNYGSDKSSSLSQEGDMPLVVMVLGAGRGPLVKAVLDAVSNNSCACKLKIFAVEKNPNAIYTLNYLRETKWAAKDVRVVKSYMNEFRVPEEEKADIVVSELLGAFGDNELSPECLDGAIHLMKSSCLSVPFAYTSYIAPVMSAKLYASVRALADNPRHLQSVLESTWVVRPLNNYMIDEPAPVFTFNHPNFELTSNDRFAEITFTAKVTCEIHGLLGFFRAYLYDDYRLTILPNVHTPGLFSWFPIFFPFRQAIFVKKDEKIVVNFWRCSDPRHVWYEWCLKKPVQTPIMNCKGRSCVIRKL